MADRNVFLESTAQSLSDTLHRVINNTFIVEYGIIKDIPSEGIVTVEMSVAEEANKIVITDCVLASFASSSVTVRIKPNVDDKVMVLFPRKFHNKMFQQDENEPILSVASTGYNVLSGVAILLNQYQEDTHKNFIDISDGNLTMKLGYNEKKDTNNIIITTDADGKYEIDNGNSTVTVDKDGNVTVNAMKGKITIKNDSASLYDILKGMLDVLNKSLATAGSPASHTVVPNQFSTQSTDLGNLMQ